jgi:hypothetical protein
MDPLLNDDATVRYADIPEREVHNAPLRSYPPAVFRGPLFEAKDKLAILLAAIMMIGPLAALPLGFGS